MVPRFVNPHLLQQSTQTVSRADLENDVSASEVKNDDLAVVSTLENMLKRSFGDFQDSSLALAEDSTVRQKKYRRRKEKTEDDANTTAGILLDEQFVEFRLFSKATKLVSLRPKPAPQIVVPGASLEDDDYQAAVRAERARAAAVDASLILEESQRPYVTRPNADKIVTVVAGESFASNPLMVLEFPGPKSLPVLPTDAHASAFRNLPSKERPCPHDFPLDKICCPVISTSQPQSEPSPSGRERRRRIRHKKHPAEPNPPASFWRPLQEWGGKSRGYAMGYEGSRPVPTGSVRQWRYRRDTMKTGTFCT